MKSKAVLAFFGFAVALALSLPATAQKSTDGFYAGATLGQSLSSKFCDGLGPTCLDKRDAWRVLGGYQFNRYFAVETGFHNLGDRVDDDPAVLKNAVAKAVDFVGVLSYPAGGDFAVFGKAGAYRGSIKGSLMGASFSESNSGATFGMGLQWNFLKPVSLRAEWQSYHRMGGGNAGPKVDILAWSIGAIFWFQ